MRTSVVFALLAASGLILTGCSVELPTATVTVTATPSPTSTDAASGSASGEAEGSGPLAGASKVGATCNDLVQPPVMQQDFPGFAVNPSPVLDAGQWADMKAIGGIVCAWTNGTGNIVIGFANPTASSITALETAFGKTYAQTDAFGALPETVGYYGKLGGTPDAEIFVAGYWVSITGTMFTSADDAIPLFSSINQVIPQA
ncbi:MAG: hypothetical protein V4479_01970 [Actinomycetota bacterium]